MCTTKLGARVPQRIPLLSQVFALLVLVSFLTSCGPTEVPASDAHVFPLTGNAQCGSVLNSAGVAQDFNVDLPMLPSGGRFGLFLEFEVHGLVEELAQGTIIARLNDRPVLMTVIHPRNEEIPGTVRWFASGLITGPTGGFETTDALSFAYANLGQSSDAQRGRNRVTVALRGVPSTSHFEVLVNCDDSGIIWSGQHPVGPADLQYSTDRDAGKVVISIRNPSAVIPPIALNATFESLNVLGEVLETRQVTAPNGSTTIDGDLPTEWLDGAVRARVDWGTGYSASTLLNDDPKPPLIVRLAQGVPVGSWGIPVAVVVLWVSASTLLADRSAQPRVATSARRKRWATTRFVVVGTALAGVTAAFLVVVGVDRAWREEHVGAPGPTVPWQELQNVPRLPEDASDRIARIVEASEVMPVEATWQVETVQLLTSGGAESGFVATVRHSPPAVKAFEWFAPGCNRAVPGKTASPIRVLLDADLETIVGLVPVDGSWELDDCD